MKKLYNIITLRASRFMASFIFFKKYKKERKKETCSASEKKSLKNRGKQNICYVLQNEITGCNYFFLWGGGVGILT